METIEYKGFNINIDYDEYAESPRDWDNLGTMACFHNRYDLGDKHDIKADAFSSWDEMRAYIEKEHNPLVILPLFLYDHSGISIRTCVHGQHSSWDGGWVGFIFVSKEKVKEEWKVKRISPKLKKKIEELLLGEINTYDDYIQGSVYHYSVDSEEGESIDTCSGFYGYDHDKSGLLEHAKNEIDCYIEAEKEKKQARLKFLIKNKVALQHR